MGALLHQHLLTRTRFFKPMQPILPGLLIE
jgi:hypothetical protein